MHVSRWRRADDVAHRFDDVAHMLAMLDIDKTWRAATEVERRGLIDEFMRRSRCYRITSK